jgi:predicted phosphodiesterase
MNIFKRTAFPILACFFVWSSGHGLTQDRKSQVAPPVIAGIPDVIIDQNAKVMHAVDLWQCTSDPDTPVSAILFGVSRADESYAENINLAKIEDNRYLNISPDEGWTGEEEILVEANDGTNIGYAAFKVIVRSTEAGRKIEAEDGTQVERKGAWVTMRQAGTNWLQSSRPGDSLRLKWKGSSLSVILWGRKLNLIQPYYQSPDYSVTYYSWKNYRPGVAAIRIDGKQTEEIDLSRAEKKGWSEFLVASGLEPGDHELEIAVKEGFVGLDGFRESPDPLSRLDIAVTDEYRTPLADIVLRFSQGGALKTVLRTTPEGRIPTFFGLKEGTYDLELMPDSNPGYTMSTLVEENILPQKREKIEIKAGQSVKLDFVLNYSGPGFRSVETIRRPLGTIPAILEKGSLLDVECRADGKPKKIRVFLLGDGLPRELKVVSAEFGPRMIMNALDPGLLIKAKIPENIPEALYGLRVSLDGREDHAARAVKVVSEFKTTYKFVQLSDLHIQGTKENRANDEALRRIAEDVNLLSPEFVIMTGDIADCGSRPEYLRFLDTLSAFKVPTFVIPGNHDHYFWHMRYLSYGFDEYRKYVGQSFFAFDYGQDRFVGLDTGDYEKIPESAVEGIHAAQWPWLIEAMEKAKSRQGLLCLFAHYDHTQNVPDAYQCRDQLISLFDKYPVDLYLWGHGHTNKEEKIGPRPTLSIETGSTIQGVYRVLEVENSRITGHLTLTAVKKDPNHEEK